MYPEELISKLESSGILIPDNERNELEISRQFINEIKKIDEEPHQESVGKNDDTYFTDEKRVTQLEAVKHFSDNDLTDQESILSLALIDFAINPPPSKGSPNSFFSINADLLRPIAEYQAKSIVYVWLDDCDPCDIMRDEFDDIFDVPPEDIALYSVYGPEWTDLLKEEYDIVGGPTTLFLIHGSVDTRLHRAHYREVIENEIRKLREA